MTTLGFSLEAVLGQNGCFYITLIHKTFIKIEFNLSKTINVRVYPSAKYQFPAYDIYIYSYYIFSYLYFCFYTAKSIDICCF